MLKIPCQLVQNLLWKIKKQKIVPNGPQNLQKKNLSLICFKLSTWGSRIGKNLQFIANTLEMSPFDGIERTLMRRIMNDDDD